MKENLPLTKKEVKVLKYLMSFIARLGYMPTLREISAYFGFKHPSGAKYYIDSLIQKGYLKRYARRQSGIVFTPAIKAIKEAVDKL